MSCDYIQFNIGARYSQSKYAMYASSTHALVSPSLHCSLLIILVLYILGISPVAGFATSPFIRSNLSNLPFSNPTCCLLSFIFLDPWSNIDIIDVVLSNLIISPIYGFEDLRSVWAVLVSSAHKLNQGTAFSKDMHLLVHLSQSQLRLHMSSLPASTLLLCAYRQGADQGYAERHGKTWHMMQITDRLASLESNWIWWWHMIRNYLLLC